MVMVQELALRYFQKGSAERTLLESFDLLEKLEAEQCIEMYNFIYDLYRVCRELFGTRFNLLALAIILPEMGRCAQIEGDCDVSEHWFRQSLNMKRLFCAQAKSASTSRTILSLATALLKKKSLDEAEILFRE